MVAPPTKGPDQQLPPRAIWWTCFAIGLAAGVLEVGSQVLHGERRPGMGFGPDLVWMAPLSSLGWFLLLAALLVATRRWGRWTLRTTVGLAVALGVVGCLLIWWQLHWVAKILLPIGVGVQAGRLAHRRPFETGVLLRWTAVSTGLLIVVGGIALAGYRRWSERAAVASLPASQASPNVLLLILDTVRASSLSLLGETAPTTPGLERWGRDGVVFTRALVTAPWTLPSHASMFTGQWAHQQSSGFRRALDGTHRTVAEAFRDAGFVTAGFVGNLVYCTKRMGLARGFIHYEDYPVNFGELLQSSALTLTLLRRPWFRRLLGYHDVLGRKRAPRLTRDFLRWSDANRDRPFFAFLNFYDAHEPYLPPEDFERKFVNPDVPRQFRYLYFWHDVVPLDRTLRSQQQNRRELQAYQASIAQIDLAVDSLLQRLADRGALERTIVIVTSDHGEHFGERGRQGHTTSVLTQVLHVPLLIRYPAKVPRGLRLEQPVTLRDLPATMLDLAGLGPGGFPGKSLGHSWADSAEARQSDTPILASLKEHNGPWHRSIVLGRFHYIDDPKSRGLFDIIADPLEETDLLGRPEVASIAERAAILLDSLHPSPKKRS